MLRRVASFSLQGYEPPFNILSSSLGPGDPPLRLIFLSSKEKGGLCAPHIPLPKDKGGLYAPHGPLW